MKAILLSCACFASAAVLPVAAAVEDEGATMSRDTADDAPEYDSDANLDHPGTFTGPEDNARPGAVFFRKGARAFEKKEYAFAIEMYRVAASWAYKPAQYNLAIIYAKGEGVPADLPRAMAWMALAAERGEKRYVEASEAIYAALSDEEFAHASAIWRELEPTYGDEVALRRAKTRWRETRNAATGSRVGFVGALSVGANRSTGRDDGGHQSVSSSPMDLTRTENIDGSIAYRQLRESDNPYDRKFLPPTGTASVGPLIDPDAEKGRSDDAGSGDQP